MPIQLSGSGSITGVSTLRSLSSLDVTGSVSVGGTLIYDDVTNIDSIGIVTARSDVHVGSALSVTGISTFSDDVKIPFDNKKLIVGADNDLELLHTSGNSIIKNTTSGSLLIHGDQIDLRPTTESGEVMLRGIRNAGVELRYDNSKKFETTNTGAVVTGILTATSLQQSIEYPSIRPTLDLNFAATKTLDRRITFTRDSLGTYVGEDGLVKYASNNVPRFDHDPATGESLGLLIEESKTNLFTYSENFDSWGTAYRTTISLNAAISPSGQLNASKFNVTTDTGYHARSFSITGGTYTVSIFAKAGEYNGIQITGSNTNQDHACFNLVNGTAYHSGTNVTNIKIENFGNGWYRCSARLPLTNGNLFVAITDGTTTSWLPSFTGSNASDGIYIWGAQIESGSFATSYIPTSGSTVTRAADIPKIEGTNLTSFYNNTEGTVFAEYQNLKTNDTNGRVWAIGNNANQTFIINAASSTTVQGQFYNSSGNGYEYNPGAVSATNAFNKVALGMKNNNTNLCVNGTLGTNDTSITLIDFSSAGTFSIGRSEHYSPRELNGCVRRLSYYNKRLPDAQLQGLTQQ